MTTVVYLGDGDVGEAVVYGLPFIVGEPVTLPAHFAHTAKIVGNPTFAVVEPVEKPKAPAKTKPVAR